MNARNSGSLVGSPGVQSTKPSASTGTQVFPLPPLLSESAARPLAAPGAKPGVSMFSTVGVGAQLPQPEKGLVVRAVNEPTRIFVVSPSLVADAAPSFATLHRTETPATPSFAAVPNVPFSRSSQVVASRLLLSPDPAGSTAPPRSTIRPSAPANPIAQSLDAPLLRAFEDQRPRAPTWTTAKTITASLRPAAKEDESARAAVDRRAPIRPVGGKTKAGAPSPQRFFAALRPSLAPTKKISALLVTAAVMVGLGTVGGRTIAQKLVSSRAAASIGALDTGAINMTSAAASPPADVQPFVALEPESAPRPERPSEAEAATPEPSPKSTPATPVVHATPSRENASPAREGGPSQGATLARKAVDALLAGDRAKALLHYGELSRTAPDREVYREAIRLLASSASETHHP